MQDLLGAGKAQPEGRDDAGEPAGNTFISNSLAVEITLGKDGGRKD